MIDWLPALGYRKCTLSKQRTWVITLQFHNDLMGICQKSCVGCEYHNIVVLVHQTDQHEQFQHPSRTGISLFEKPGFVSTDHLLTQLQCFTVKLLVLAGRLSCLQEPKTTTSPRWKLASVSSTNLNTCKLDKLASALSSKNQSYETKGNAISDGESCGSECLRVCAF